MKLIKLPYELTVCKLRSAGGIDLTADYCFIGLTDEEISLVCRTECTPPDTVVREDGWCGFRIGGTLDFSMTGILSGISAVLADNGIGIFAISTYNTDYILVKGECFSKAAEVLEAAGYDIPSQQNDDLL